MPNDLALQQKQVSKKPSADDQSIALPRVALRFLPRVTRDFETVFGIPDLPLARRCLREQLYHRGFREEVLDALHSVPRHVFAPTRAAVAYVDIALVEQSFVQAPSVVATVVSTLSSPDARVLEMGTGSGYQSAVLAAFGAQVTTIDLNETTQRAARERFNKLDLHIQTLIRSTDPIRGLEPYAFDLIVVNEALHRMPRRLLGLLREGGSIVGPVTLADETVRLVRFILDQGDRIHTVDLGRCFAPLPRKRGA